MQNIFYVTVIASSVCKADSAGRDVLFVLTIAELLLYSDISFMLI